MIKNIEKNSYQKNKINVYERFFTKFSVQWYFFKVNFFVYRKRGYILKSNILETDPKKKNKEIFCSIACSVSSHKNIFLNIFTALF